MLARTVRLYRNSFGGLSRDIWMLSLITLVNRAGSMVLPFLTIYLTQELGFTLGEAGIAMSCFGVGSVVGSYVGGRLTDKLGYYNVQYWSLFTGGMLFFVLMQMKTLVGFCIAIFVLTAVMDAFRPANLASISVYSRPENRTRSLSLIRLSINLGVAIGPAAGGLLAATLGYSWLFVVDAITCVGAALLFRAVLENKKEELPDSTTADQAPLDTDAPVYRDRIYMIFLGFMLLAATSFVQIISTLPVFFKSEFLLTEGQIGLLLALNGLVIVVIEMPIIYVLEQRFSNLTLVGMGALLIGLSYLVFNISGTWVGIAILSILLLTFGEIINFPFSNAYASARSAAHNRGRYMGLYSMMFAISHVIAPGLGMFIAEWFGYMMLWNLMGLFGVLAFVGFWLMEKGVFGE